MKQRFLVAGRWLFQFQPLPKKSSLMKSTQYDYASQFYVISAEFLHKLAYDNKN